jgi:hypothetical protein
METAFDRVGEIAAVAPNVVEEAVEEMVGASPRKWAVVLVAFALGVGVAVAAITLGKRRTAETAREPDSDTPVVPPAPATEVQVASSSEPSGWSSRHPRIARSEAQLRARVTGIENRLHVRRESPVARESEPHE